MSIYTVLSPRKPDSAPDPTAFVFVKDGFCWPALFIPGVWMIFRRLWLVLALYLAAAILFGLFAGMVEGIAPFALYLLARFLVALEANGLRRWTLERRGFALIDVVEARNAREAEIRFFADWETEPQEPVPSIVPQAPAKPVAWQPSAEAGEVVGLFPAPGGAT
jgi:hypothetical protein